MPAAGGLYATVADLGRFLAGWRSLLPADLAAVAISAQAPIPSGGWQGYGWRISKDTGDAVVRHGGGILGFRGSLMWNTDTGRASVVLVNSESDGVEDLGRLLLVTT